MNSSDVWNDALILVMHCSLHLLLLHWDVKILAVICLTTVQRSQSQNVEDQEMYTDEPCFTNICAKNSFLPAAAASVQTLYTSHEVTEINQ